MGPVIQPIRFKCHIHECPHPPPMASCHCVYVSLELLSLL